MVSEARDHFGRLPTELLILVIEDPSLSTGDLAALAVTCRKSYTTTNPILYQRHLKENGGQACKPYLPFTIGYSDICLPWLTRIESVMWAVSLKRFTTIRRFLENGADINDDKMYRAYVEEEESIGPWNVVFDWDPLSLFTPLALAAALGHDSMVAFLLDHGADIEKPGKGLCMCADGENIVELNVPPMKGGGGYDDTEYIMDDENGLLYTPLHFALCRGHESTAILLLERGANPQETCSCSAGPWNALHTATRMNQRKVIDYILNNKLVDINEGGREGLTPLLLAFYEEHYSLADMYMDRGADINAVWDSQDGGWTIFGMACLREKFSRASDLLERGADPDLVIKDWEFGTEWTALGLVYGNLFGEYLRRSGWHYEFDRATQTRARRKLEKKIIQAKIDRALQQQRKKDRD